LAGPDLLNSLVGVLQKFRQNPIAVTADVKVFFHQIFVDENDSAVFRLFWFDDESMKTLAEHEMIVHTFGAKQSPCVSTFTLRHHGKKMSGQISEEVLRAILENFYVDDFLDSYNTIAEARKVRIEITEVLASGGFPLTKWKSTHPEVLKDEDQQDEDLEPFEAEAKDVKIFEDHGQVFEKSEKVLGVSYSFDEDVFSIHINDRDKQSVTTCRQMMGLKLYI
jgi:hypothetical protein